MANWIRICCGMLMVGMLSGCVYQPLYGAGLSASGGDTGQIWVEEVDSRVGQQVRNHLIFLLQGGNDDPDVRFRARIRAVGRTRNFAAVRGVRDQTAGTVTVTVSYSLFDTQDRKTVASGQRVVIAPFDRTGQSFANERAERDAANRAAREVAEQLRLAFAADLSA